MQMTCAVKQNKSVFNLCNVRIAEKQLGNSSTFLIWYQFQCANEMILFLLTSALITLLFFWVQVCCDFLENKLCDDITAILKYIVGMWNNFIISLRIYYVNSNFANYYTIIKVIQHTLYMNL